MTTDEISLRQRVWPARDGGDRRLRLVRELLLYVVIPGLWVVGLLSIWIGHADLGYDLKLAYLPAAEDVMRGESPYPHGSDPAITSQRAYVYPPLLAWLIVPATVAPVQVVAYAGVLLSFVAAAAVLAIVGVRDWRCYALALAWAPVVNSAVNATVSLPLAVVVAAAWRWRSSEVRSGVMIGLAAALKTFAWPLLLWQATCGRWRGFVAGVVTSAGLVLGSWALIAFQDIAYFPRLLRRVTELEEAWGYSISGVLISMGVERSPARFAALLVAIALVAAAFRFGRKGDATRSFIALLFATLAATPILWQHYLTLLLVALAITRPRVCVWWFLPLALYAAPWIGNGDAWQTLLVPAVVVALGIVTLSTPSRDTFRPWPRRVPGSSDPGTGFV